MKDRIQRIIARENLTPSKFADIIGVQRSGVSHILSGRNNPGLDFLNKILQHFPHISGDWLITGQGSMVKMTTNLPKAAASGLFDNMEEGSKIKVTSEPQVSQVEPHADVKNKPADTESSNRLVNKDESKTMTANAPSFPPIEHQSINNQEVTIEKVLVFYTNKTFKEYFPAKD